MSINLKVIKIQAVLEQTAISRSHMYNLISQGKFPNSIKLGIRSSGWVETEVQDWIKAQILKSNNKHKQHKLIR